MNNDIIFPSGCLSLRSNITGEIRIYKLENGHGFEISYTPCGMFAARGIKPQKVRDLSPEASFEGAQEIADNLKAAVIRAFNQKINGA